MKNFTEYLSHFGEPATNNWKVELLDGAREARITTPNSAEQTFDIDSPLSLEFWRQIYVKDHASTKLWIRSLWYAVMIAEKGGEILADNILRSYESFLDSAELNPDAIGMNSLDHCLALNLRACARISLNPELTSPELNRTTARLSAKVTQIVARADFFKANNHGVMLALGVLHSNVAFSSSRKLISFSFCEEFLLDTFEQIINDDGFVAENTPSYQLLWVDWVRETALTFSVLYDRVDRARDLHRLADLIEENLRFFIVNDERILPIGDGGSVAKLGFTPRDGFYVSEKDGTFIWNNAEGTVLSYICGFRSPTHKHADDLSLRLWLSGKEFLADGGAFSYDLKDWRSRQATSQKGHSRLAFPEFDDIPGPHFYPWNNMNSRIRTSFSFESDSGLFLIKSLQVIDETYRGSRHLRISPEQKSLRLDDFATGPAADTPVQRFLVPNDIDIVSKPEGLLLSSSSESLLICSHHPGFLSSPSKFVKQAPRDVALLSQGDSFLSPRPGEVAPAALVEIPLEKVGVERWSGRVDIKISIAE